MTLKIFLTGLLLLCFSFNSFADRPPCASPVSNPDQRTLRVFDTGEESGEFFGAIMVTFLYEIGLRDGSVLSIRTTSGQTLRINIQLVNRYDCTDDQLRTLGGRFITYEGNPEGYFDDGQMLCRQGEATIDGCQHAGFRIWRALEPLINASPLYRDIFNNDYSPADVQDFIVDVGQPARDIIRTVLIRELAASFRVTVAPDVAPSAPTARPRSRR